jgi:hypothetical protein
LPLSIPAPLIDGYADTRLRDGASPAGMPAPTVVRAALLGPAEPVRGRVGVQDERPQQREADGADHIDGLARGAGDGTVERVLIHDLPFLGVKGETGEWNG